MKTKYLPIVKLKENEVKKLENDLVKVNVSIEMIEKEIENKKNVLASFSLPQKGSFGLFSQVKYQIALVEDEIKRLNSKKDMLLSRKKDILNHLRELRIELEKFKYLHNEELKKFLKQKALKESRDMDEIAIMLKNRRRFDE